MPEMFGRYARLQVDATGATGSLEFLYRGREVAENWSLAFDVSRDLSAKPSQASIKIRNLSPAKRKALGESIGLCVRLSAGYENATGKFNGLIHVGDVRTVTHSREGADWVTELATGDGEKAAQTARLSKAYGKGTAASAPVRDLLEAMGASPQAIAKATAKLAAGTMGKTYANGTVMTGSASRELTRALKGFGYSWSSQNGEVEIIPIGKALDAPPVILSPVTGLIGVPSIAAKGQLSATSLLNPNISPGRLVSVQSSTVIGVFRVEKVNFTGDTYGDEWFCKVEGKPY